MKILAGYENQSKTDYRAKAAEEVVKVQEKAKLLEERLQDLKPGDQLTEGDVFEVRNPFTIKLEPRLKHSVGSRKCSTERTTENTEDV